MSIPRGWHTRGHLPHADFAGLMQAVTFRLADALPDTALERIRLEVARQAVGDTAAERRAILLRERVQTWLDGGYGSCRLGRADARQAVANALHRQDGASYRLDAFIVMPNHVHVLIGVSGVSLGRIVQGWKGTSARAINLAEATSGSLWQREYYDRFIRDESHAVAALRYIAANPEKAGLGGWDWPGLWVRDGLKGMLKDTAD